MSSVHFLCSYLLVSSSLKQTLASHTSFTSATVNMYRARPPSIYIHPRSKHDLLADDYADDAFSFFFFASSAIIPVFVPH